MVRDISLMKKLLSLAVVLASLPLASPVMAQARVLTIFGDDKCPANEICVSAPESERFRIPKDLRESIRTPDSTSWAIRAQSTLSEGYSGPNSCTTVGPSVEGCFAQEMRAARAEAKAAAAAKRDIP